jgi:predicted nucleotidyltransferase
MATKKTARGVVDAAAKAASHLDALGARFALIGGLAVGARGEPRYTRDVDLAVSVTTDEEAERLLYAMTGYGYTVDTVIEQTRTTRLATARLRHAGYPEIFVDLLFASSGIEPELVASSERIVYQRGTRLPVARIGHLIALKVLSESDERLQDRIDLEILSREATEEDWALAEIAVRLIKSRRFHRGRALVRRLRVWREAARRSGKHPA